MEEAITQEQYLSFLSLAPTNLLEQVGLGLMATLQDLPDDSPEAESIAAMLMLLGSEYEIRQVEPLWRKAKRFAIRNSDSFKQVGRVAACIGAGVILGISLDN